ncbi:hypothetical protein NBH19_22435 [Rhizobium sp. S95]|uniref:Uncharacterized protein n=1 Tax=Ciceribacter sichuanensis TaxID=2949647 RepID=A0AAJ1BV69_9HYPH|nr:MULTISPECIES: hypothetical protein [unclassified Ciceribacter]MCM2398842.1 hypothetical protein [Ciceribacter sp. S95]MCO5956952.1 hypothetical protein [Ciceribacter sp. S101]
MASTHPTPISFLMKARLIYLAVFRPADFAEEEKADSELQNKQESGTPTDPPIFQIRRALVESLAWCIGAVFIGFIAGEICVILLRPRTGLSAAFIIVGTTILLWATLASRGWSIQSFGGVTLSERLNQWIFRTLYAVGTIAVVFGTTWSVLTT